VSAFISLHKDTIAFHLSQRMTALSAVHLVPWPETPGGQKISGWTGSVDRLQREAHSCQVRLSGSCCLSFLFLFSSERAQEIWDEPFPSSPFTFFPPVVNSYILPFFQRLDPHAVSFFRPPVKALRLQSPPRKPRPISPLLERPAPEWTQDGHQGC